MKKVFSILLIFLVSTYAGRTVTIKVRDHVAIQKSIEDSAAFFIKEIKPFLETPMSWCIVEPTGEASVYPYDKKNVYLVRVTAEMSCSEKMAYSNFKSIANRYKTFILTNPPPPYKVSEEFTFEVYQKTPINDNLKIRFETIYHPTPEDIKTLQ